MFANPMGAASTSSAAPALQLQLQPQQEPEPLGSTDGSASSSNNVATIAPAEQLQALLAGAGEEPPHPHDQEGERSSGVEPDSHEGPHQPFLYRLFVGWVPKHFVEKDLKPYFSKYGTVKDIIVLKDKVTHAPRGCAFVSYATKDEAELAIANLDRKLQLPGALSLLEVRFAKSHQYVQAGTGPNNNRQLFFTSAQLHLNEHEISQVFSQYGRVEEVNLFRDRKTGSSKGCGFISFEARVQACTAMEALEHKTAEPSEEMSVQWADPELQFKKKKALEESNADNRMLFFAKVLRSATEEDVKRLFTRFGKVYDINLFRAFQGAPTTKGCGLVTMGTHEEARAAIEGLDSRYCWDGMDLPMVVKWMDAALQRRRREQHLANMLGLSNILHGLPLGPSAAVTSSPWLFQPGGSMSGNHASGGSTSSSALLQPRGGLLPSSLMQQPEAEVEEVPPLGCQPDTFKLFVGNIPKACTEDQLLPFFESIGNVAELVIVRDKAQQSKGSAFVWYIQRVHAERAILQFNLRHVLPDPSNEQDRPLVVRRARSRTGKLGIPLARLQGVTLGGPLGGPHACSSMGMVMAAAGGGSGGDGLAASSSQGLALSLSGLQPAQLVGVSTAAGQQHPALTLVAGPGHGLQGLAPGTTFYASATPGGGAKLHGLHGLEQAGLTSQAVALQHTVLGGSYVPLQQSVGYVTTGGGAAAVMHPVHTTMVHTQQAQGGTQLVSIQAAPAVSEMGLYEAYGTPSDRGVMDRYVLATELTSTGTPSGDTLAGGVPLALSLQLNLQQLGVVNAHLYSIQSMSSAQVNISPGAHGLFHLLVSGSKPQVDAARSLLSQVLGVVI